MKVIDFTNIQKKLFIINNLVFDFVKSNNTGVLAHILLYKKIRCSISKSD